MMANARAIHVLADNQKWLKIIEKSVCSSNDK